MAVEQRILSFEGRVYGFLQEDWQPEEICYAELQLIQTKQKNALGVWITTLQLMQFEPDEPLDEYLNEYSQFKLVVKGLSQLGYAEEMELECVDLKNRLENGEERFLGTRWTPRLQSAGVRAWQKRRL
jgi:hypothetical protein